MSEVKEESIEDYKNYDRQPFGNRVTIVIPDISKQRHNKIIAPEDWIEYRDKQIFEKLKKNSDLLVIAVAPALDTLIQVGDKIRLTPETMGSFFERPQYEDTLFCNVDFYNIEDKLIIKEKLEINEQDNNQEISDVAFKD